MSQVSQGTLQGQVLQDPYLNALRTEKVPVSIYLVSGIKLQGQIEAFDRFVILLKNNVSQMVYKHAISTVVPSRNIIQKIETNSHSTSHSTSHPTATNLDESGNIDNAG